MSLITHLIITRQLNESIEIGGDVEVQVVEIRGDKVRLRISAPELLPVHRKEVADRIRAQEAQKATE